MTYSPAVHSFIVKKKKSKGRRKRISGERRKGQEEAGEEHKLSLLTMGCDSCEYKREVPSQ